MQKLDHYWYFVIHLIATNFDVLYWKILTRITFQLKAEMMKCTFEGTFDSDPESKVTYTNCEV